jgi:hypothetical protein
LSPEKRFYGIWLHLGTASLADLNDAHIRGLVSSVKIQVILGSFVSTAARESFLIDGSA